jgi:hypothetical protein
MADRRPRHRAAAQAPQAWEDAYSWLMTELRSLDRQRMVSIAFRVSTLRTRRRVKFRAVTCLLSAAASADDLITDDCRDLDAEPRGLRTMLRRARDDYDRMWIARAWLSTSSEQATTPGDGATLDCLLDGVRDYLCHLAETIAVLSARGPRDV